ncbi:transcriptional regulator family: Fungal Specific TF [Paecilomyces variotii]|nr:transcriptional regulator family: Fungal Specific TF [Paecilomyces variotii]
MDEHPDLAPDNLFRYLPLHRVLICLPCQHAVQPSAVMRHLKEIHHLNHAQRKPFMEYASKFAIAGPQDVVPPDESHFPVPFLPVLNGLSCRFPGCEHLCVTTKRMRHHCLSVHQIAGREGLDWHPVKLQTFFKGNALRYFTNRSSAMPPADQPSASGSGNSSDTDLWSTRALSTPASEPTMFMTPLSPVSLSRSDSNLFHHYVNFTYLTFSSDPAVQRVFKEIVPRLAAGFPFLMHGILACSALHLAYGDPSNRPRYVIDALHHQELAIPEFRSTIMHVNDDNGESILAFAFMLVVCSLGTEEGDGGNLFLFPSGTGNDSHTIHLLRAGCSMLSPVWSKISEGPLAPLSKLWRDDLCVSIDLDTDPLLNSLFSVLPDGPSTMGFWSESVYRSAAILLVEAFEFARQRGAAFTVWDALNAWPLRVPSEYLDLLQANHPGALLLLAYYFLLLQTLKPLWFFETRVSQLLDGICLRLQGNSPDNVWQLFLEIRAKSSL